MIAPVSIALSNALQVSVIATGALAQATTVPHFVPNFSNFSLGASAQGAVPTLWSQAFAAEEQDGVENTEPFEETSPWEDQDASLSTSAFHTINSSPLAQVGIALVATGAAILAARLARHRIRNLAHIHFPFRRNPNLIETKSMPPVTIPPGWRHLSEPQVVDETTLPTMDIRGIRDRFVALGIDVAEAQIAAAILRPVPVPDVSHLLESEWEIGEGDPETIGEVSLGEWQVQPQADPAPALATPPSPAAVVQPSFTPPETFPYEMGDYILLEKLGDGGMAYVYLARHRTIRGLRFAVKLVAFDKLGVKSDEALSLFEREVRTMRDIDHPNVVQLRDSDLQHDPPYVVLEFVPGGDLNQWIRKNYGHMPYPIYENQVIQIMIGILKGLMAVEKTGVVHRDLKPENIFLDLQPDGTPIPKLGDFGIARFAARGNTLTQLNVFRGTPYLIDPAQVISALADTTFDVDTRSDIYTLGIMLYRLLTSKIPYPYRGEEAFVYLLNITRSDPIDPRRFNPKIPKELVRICLKAMHKKTGERYQTPQKFLDDLIAYSTGKTGTGARPRLGEGDSLAKEFFEN